MHTPVTLFISYAREDEVWANRLREQLAPLRQIGLVKDWQDSDIAPGDRWETNISQALETAELILALVSPSFLDSAYIREAEMARALERHARGEARVVPVILRAVAWEVTPLGRLQALPRDGKPILSHRDRDQALRDVATGLRRVLPGPKAADASSPPEATLSEAPPLFLNHTSFLRPEKQAEFRRRTGVPLDHYDIRVVVDAEDDAVLDEIERVEYLLDEGYPEPIRVRTARDRRERFLLKELANGEYLLRAKVFLRGKAAPVLLHRYITLWPSGPEL